MSTKSVFDFRDYKAYLLHMEAEGPKRGRGFRAELARTIGCQSAYVSQVLNTAANFSLEQAHALNKLLMHGRDEARFFLLLVEYGRAGTPDLKRHFQELLNEDLQRHLDLKERFKVKEVLSLEDQTTYYSDWTYTAIHMGVTISKMANADDLADFFRLPKDKVQRVLKFLSSAGLISEERGGQFKISTARIHLGRDSALLSKHHTNWRLQAMNAFEREGEKDLHYTSVVSLSEDDALAIKARFVKEIDVYNGIVERSPEEAVYCLALDFFSLKREL